MTRNSTEPARGNPLSRRVSRVVVKSLALFLLALGLGIATASADFKPVLQWGFEVGMNEPVGIAVGPDGSIYVADKVEQRIQKFNPKGELLKSWGKDGINDGEFKNPLSVEVDNAGNVYVPSADSRIQKFDADGNFLGKWGKPGVGEGQFLNPTGMAVDSDGRIYVADSGNQRIQVFNPDLSFYMAWGMPGKGDGEFLNPKGIAIDAKGFVYVSDTGNHRVQKFSISNKTAVHEATWGAQGDGPGQFDEPTALSVSPTGTLFVADTGNHRIQEFTASGEPIGIIGGKGSEPGNFYLLTGLDTGKDGELYVADTGLQRAQILAVPPQAPTALVVSPKSPGTSLVPKVAGKAPAGDVEIQIFTTADCSGDPVAKGQAAQFNGAGIEVKVAPASTTTFRAVAKDPKFGLLSACSESSVTYAQKDEVIVVPPPPGKQVGPTFTTAVFDGQKLQVRLKCPARFKPRCVSRAVPVTVRGKKGKAMAKVKKVSTRSNKWVKVTFQIKPAFRAKVQAMTTVDAKRLVVRQRITSKRIGKRKNRKASTIFHVYKVRTQG